MNYLAKTWRAAQIQASQFGHYHFTVYTLRLQPLVDTHDLSQGENALYGVHRMERMSIRDGAGFDINEQCIPPMCWTSYLCSAAFVVTYCTSLAQLPVSFCQWRAALYVLVSSSLTNCTRHLIAVSQVHTQSLHIHYTPAVSISSAPHGSTDYAWHGMGLDTTDTMSKRPGTQPSMDMKIVVVGPTYMYPNFIGKY